MILSYFSVNSILEKDVPTSHKSAENLTSSDFLHTRSFFNPKKERRPSDFNDYRVAVERSIFQQCEDAMVQR